MHTYSTQIAIVGGGICGLWLLNLLRDAGFDAWLFEKDQLGCCQTLASQGMIHGGIKYALGGFRTPASETIAGMPGVWKDCLDGHGPINLSGLNILSEDYFLFSDRGLSSKVTAFFASKAIKGRVSALRPDDYPEAFRSTQFKGNLYRLQDIVLDTQALLETLRTRHADAIFRGTVETSTRDGSITGITVDRQIHISADRYIFAAGSGNAQLLQGTPLSNIEMQIRPLQQVLVRGDLPPLYAHAVSLQDASKPKVTFSTHRSADGSNVWYLGGNLAEQGVGRKPAALIDTAKQELAALVPWISLTATSWATLNIDRAEPANQQQQRPDHPFIEASENAMVCWPTKLTLTPLLGDLVIRRLNADLTAPDATAPERPPLPTARVAPPPWDTAF